MSGVLSERGGMQKEEWQRCVDDGVVCCQILRGSGSNLGFRFGQVAEPGPQ